MNRYFSALRCAWTVIARQSRTRRTGFGVAAVLLMSTLSSPVFAQYVFSGGTITLPANPAAGSIVARSYLTPSQLCFSTSCTLSYAELYAYGGGTRVKGTPDVPTTVSGLTTRLIVNGQPILDGPITPNLVITSSIEVQLVANGKPITSGSVLADGSTPSPAYFIIYFGGQKYQIFLNANIQAINGTCSVPDQTVPVPSVAPSKFTGPGTTAGGQSFSIQFTGCPAGFNRVGYTLHPLGSAATKYAGELPLSAGSTATGVGIQVTSGGSAATFNTSLPLSAYSKTAPSNLYSLPFSARYIQTGSTITPGTVNGQMQVLMDYQ